MGLVERVSLAYFQNVLVHGHGLVTLVRVVAVSTRQDGFNGVGGGEFDLPTELHNALDFLFLLFLISFFDVSILSIFYPTYIFITGVCLSQTDNATCTGSVCLAKRARRCAVATASFTSPRISRATFLYVSIFEGKC